MSIGPRIPSPLGYLAAAALAAILTGCASTPPPTASTASAMGSPASTSELRDVADFTKKAQNEGWVPQVRGGQVIYCMDETPLNSRLPERTCLNEASLQQRMLAEERQRQSAQRAAPAGCMPGRC